MSGIRNINDRRRQSRIGKAHLRIWQVLPAFAPMTNMPNRTDLCTCVPITQSRAFPLDINVYSGIAEMGRGFPIDVLTTRRNVTIIPSGRRAHRITPRLELEICIKLSAIIVIK